MDDNEDGIKLLLKENGLDTEKTRNLSISDAVDMLLENASTDGSSESPNSQGGWKEELVGQLKDILETTGDDTITIQDVYNLSNDILHGKLPKPSLRLSEDEQKTYSEASLQQKKSLYVTDLAQNISNIVKVYFLSSWYTILKQTLLPLIVFHLLFCALVVLTLDIIHFEFSSNIIFCVTSVLKHDKKKIDAYHSHFTTNSMKLFWQFFLVSFLLSAFYALCEQKWMMSPLFCIISFACTVWSIQAKGGTGVMKEWSFDALVVLLLSSRILASYGGNLNKNFLSFSFNEYISINFNVSSTLQMLTISLLIIFAIKESLLLKPYGFLKILFPTIVSLVWMQFFLEFFQHSSWSGLTQVVFCWLMALLALPLLLTYVVRNMAFGFLESFYEMTLMEKLIVLLILAACIIVLVKHLLSYKVNELKSFLFYTTLIFGLFMFLLALNKGYGYDIPLEHKELTVDKFCSSYESNVYSNEEKKIRATDYIGKQVTWNGTLIDKNFLSVTNKAWDIISKFPIFLHPLMKCAVGKRNGSFAPAVLVDTCSLRDYTTHLISFKMKVTCDEDRFIYLTLYGSKREHMDSYKLISLDENASIPAMFTGRFSGQYTVDLLAVCTEFDLPSSRDQHRSQSFIKRILATMMPSLKFLFGPIVSINLPETT